MVNFFGKLNLSKSRESKMLKTTAFFYFTTLCLKDHDTRNYREKLSFPSFVTFAPFFVCFAVNSFRKMNLSIRRKQNAQNNSFFYVAIQFLCDHDNQRWGQKLIYTFLTLSL